jgi:magnesium transporter
MHFLAEASMNEGLPVDSEDEREDEYELDHELAAAVMESVDAGDRVGVLALIADLHVADLADLTEQIDAAHRRRFIELVWADIDQEILVEVEEGVRDEILSFLAPEKLPARGSRGGHPAPGAGGDGARRPRGGH